MLWVSQSISSVVQNCLLTFEGSLKQISSKLYSGHDTLAYFLSTFNMLYLCFLIFISCQTISTPLTIYIYICFTLHLLYCLIPYCFAKEFVSVLPILCVGLMSGNKFLLLNKKNCLHLSLGDIIKSCASVQVFLTQEKLLSTAITVLIL